MKVLVSAGVRSNHEVEFDQQPLVGDEVFYNGKWRVVVRRWWALYDKDSYRLSVQLKLKDGKS